MTQIVKEEGDTLEDVARKYKEATGLEWGEGLKMKDEPEPKEPDQ